MSAQYFPCSACGAQAPNDYDRYPMGPINWLYQIHWPTAHPERYRAGLERLRRDLMDEAS